MAFFVKYYQLSVDDCGIVWIKYYLQRFVWEKSRGNQKSSRCMIYIYSKRRRFFGFSNFLWLQLWLLSWNLPWKKPTCAKKRCLFTVELLLLEFVLNDRYYLSILQMRPPISNGPINNIQSFLQLHSHLPWSRATSSVPPAFRPQYRGLGTTVMSSWFPVSIPVRYRCATIFRHGGPVTHLYFKKAYQILSGSIYYAESRTHWACDLVGVCLTLDARNPL